MWLHRLAHWMQNDTRCVLMTGLFGTLISLGLAAVYVPAPSVHDEFSYLLSADTFANGRVTNDTHPHWPHFETFHVIHEPSYIGKYPPGQAITLAIGQILGHPIIGSALATGISMAALMWMLIGWLPRKANLFTFSLVVTHPGLQLLWGQSYMGGAVAMTGGALLLGAFIRLTDKLEIRYSVLAAMGVSILAISRPLEGAVLTLLVGGCLVWRLQSWSECTLQRWAFRVAVPVVLVGCVSGGLFLGYNALTTGNPFVMPYQIHEDKYALTPLFPWKESAPARSYQNEVVRDFYEDDFRTAREKYATFSSLAGAKLDVAIKLTLFFLGSSLIIGLAGLPVLIRDSKARLALLIMVPSLLVGFLTPWGHAHYVAPAAPLVFLFAIGGLVELWHHRDQWKIVRRWNWRTVIAMQAIWFVILGMKVTLHEMDGWHVQRRSLERELVKAPGKDLVFVSYSDEHTLHSEWVYNGADIDGSEVVWAREMSPEMNQALIDYFGERKVWKLKPDKSPFLLTPYDESIPALP